MRNVRFCRLGEIQRGSSEPKPKKTTLQVKFMEGVSRHFDLQSGLVCSACNRGFLTPCKRKEALSPEQPVWEGGFVGNFLHRGYIIIIIGANIIIADTVMIIISTIDIITIVATFSISSILINTF